MRFAFFGDMAIRGWDFPYGWAPRSKSEGPWGSSPSPTSTYGSSDTSDDRGDRRSSGGGGAIIAIVIAVAIILVSWGLSTLIRLALSRSREYLADAGSAELTKNPDALIRALQEHVKAKLAPYKYPRWIEFRAELPKTATGKIQRFKLRAEGH